MPLTNGTIAGGLICVTETDRAVLPAVPTAPSLRARVSAAVTRLTLGTLTSFVPMNHPGGVWFGRGLIATIMGTLGSMPDGTRVIPVRTPEVRGEWVLGPGVQFGKRVGYYVHGSAYVICSTGTHRKLIAQLSEAAGVPFFSVEYRLAPEHLFPAAADDVEAGYRWLLAQGYAASDVVIGADSAGGHLTCDMLLACAGEANFRPAGVVLFSPLIDLSLGMALELEKDAYRDPAMSATAAREMVGVYTRGQDPSHPRLKLDFARADQLPPILTQVGGFEMLRADARYLDDQLRTNGGTSTLEIWPGMVHVFQALPYLAPEAGPALRRAAAFITDALAATTTDRLEEVG